MHRNGPGRERRAEAVCVGTPGWGAPRGKVGQPKVLAPRYVKSGGLFAAIPLGPLQALRLGLRIADGFSQHLTQLSLSLRWFSREGFLPLRHKHYVEMR